jgi:lipopolysaccharide transport system permease protein
MADDITTYEPDNSIRRGYVSGLRDIGRELVRTRWLTYQLFKRDFLAMYKQAVIGFIWALVVPIIGMGTFLVLNQSGVLSLGDIGVPYPVYAILGLAYWQLFSTGIVACSNSLVNAGIMIKKINFSKKSLVIAAIGQSMIPFIVQMCFVIILFVYYGFAPSIAILLAPLFMIPIVLLTLGLGFLLSLLNGVVRDVGNIVPVVSTFLMFLTPVLYARPTSGFLATLTDVNPLYYMVSGARDIILTGGFDEWQGLLLSCGLSLFVFISCLIFFHLTEVRVAERI